MPHAKSKLLLSGIRVVQKYCSDPVEEPPMLRQMLSKAIFARKTWVKDPKSPKYLHTESRISILRITTMVWASIPHIDT